MTNSRMGLGMQAKFDSFVNYGYSNTLSGTHATPIVG
ncbi:hypothetical protein SAMN05421877_103215 [Sphingobacterium lactis]|uniref:Uncharacterized protein n=1 Tax=Sphingobacterium lactis TaxID=797291 RepID=A0A1H5VRN4_9SPHI|nr:hypothetical protein SAMN05421877_103215 [Sphingobacterium lactis]